MLKLCSKKLTRSGRRMRATPDKNDAFAVFFHNDSDVAKHLLSFLDTNSDGLVRRVSEAVKMRSLQQRLILEQQLAVVQQQLAAAQQQLHVMQQQLQQLQQLSQLS
ncbi:hypothetical protein TrRE_jg12780 [Triparma retinervis]|uniref:Uncharacterized protein n=1 Tax=Triparma retinervis TaxID=2557542 RepID=A0A9W7AML3_9STRA|nr:hypothetical protein TrRE_jg12780 [Triparma retinervis]